MRLVVPALCLSLVPWLGGCAPFSGCGTADEELVEKVMGTARTDFMAGGADGSRISRLELEDARSSDLPEDLRKFGMAELLAVDVVAWFADEPEDSPFGGMHIPMGFAVNAEHTRFIPAEELARESFEVEDGALADPDYEEWAASVQDSEAMDAALECVRE